MRRFIAIFMTLCLVLGLSGVSVWANDESYTWQEEPRMPISPFNFGACTVGDKIFVLGGKDSNSVAIYIPKIKFGKWGHRCLKLLTILQEL